MGLLLNANGANAAYLFQPDKEYRELDYGEFLQILLYMYRDRAACPNPDPDPDPCPRPSRTLTPDPCPRNWPSSLTLPLDTINVGNPR